MRLEISTAGSIVEGGVTVFSVLGRGGEAHIPVFLEGEQVEYIAVLRQEWGGHRGKIDISVKIC